jgi:hypothetical protein
VLVPAAVSAVVSAVIATILAAVLSPVIALVVLPLETAARVLHPHEGHLLDLLCSAFTSNGANLA